MKKIGLLTLMLFAVLGLHAQNSNVILFTENGEGFFAILNGLRQNDTPVTNIKFQDLNAPSYKLKIIFEDKSLGEMAKNLYVNPGVEASWRIKLSKKGAYKLGFVSEVPIAQAPPPPPMQEVIIYNPNPRPAANITITEQTTTTTTTGGNGSTTEGVSMNINVDGFGMDVKVGSTGGNGSVNTSTTTTITTTETNTGWANEGNTEVYVEEVGCAKMAYGDFESAKSSIKSKSFSESKMTLARQITKNNCLTADQVKQVMQLFDFEDDRLEYAKFAYGFCYDPNNYYKVNDAFTFESSIEELDSYISSSGR